MYQIQAVHKGINYMMYFKKLTILRYRLDD